MTYNKEQLYTQMNGCTLGLLCDLKVLQAVVRIGNLRSVAFLLYIFLLESCQCQRCLKENSPTFNQQNAVVQHVSFCNLYRKRSNRKSYKVQKHCTKKITICVCASIIVKKCMNLPLCYHFLCTLDLTFLFHTYDINTIIHIGAIYDFMYTSYLVKKNVRFNSFTMILRGGAQQRGGGLHGQILLL